MVRSMCQGGISRLVTLVLIERAHGRTSAKVISDIGAGVPGRWHAWQERCMIGSTSLVKVGEDAGELPVRRSALREVTHG